MTELQSYPVKQHRFQTFAVMTLVGGAVLGVGYEVTGGPDSIRNYIENAKQTSFGLKNINIDAGKHDGKSASIGIAASTCLNTAAYSVDGVYEVQESSASHTYKVKVQKVGQGTLNAAAVESCILKETGSRVELFVAH